MRLILGLLLSLLFSLSAAQAADAPAAPVNADKAVEWSIGDTLYLAGRDVTVTRKFTGGLTITGETVTVTDAASIKSNLWIAAQRAAVEGDIGGDLSLRTPDALINGHVKGNVSFYGMRLSFGPDARIDGDVTYYAASPALIDEGAIIKGKVNSYAFSDTPQILTPPPPAQQEAQRSWSAPGYEVSLGGAIFFGLLAAGVTLLSRNSAPRLRVEMGAHPVLSFLIGLAWLIATPIVALMAAFTIIGLPLTLLIILLWPLAVLAGIVASILALSDMLFRLLALSDGWLRRVIVVAVASVIVTLGLSMPALGALVWLVVVSLGIGATALSFRSQIST